MSAARLTDRSPESGAKGQRRSDATRITRSESLPTLSGSYRVSRGRLEVLRGELTATDWAMLGTLQRVRLATGRQLQLLHVTEASPLANARRARRRLEALTAKRVLVRLPRRVGGLAGGSAQFVYALDTAGQRLTGPRSRGARRPWLPGPDHLRHALAISETYVAMSLAQRAAGFELLDWSTEPVCWRTAGGVWGSVGIKPDAFVRARVAGASSASGSRSTWPPRACPSSAARPTPTGATTRPAPSRPPRATFRRFSGSCQMSVARLA